MEVEDMVWGALEDRLHGRACTMMFPSLQSQAEVALEEVSKEAEVDRVEVIAAPHHRKAVQQVLHQLVHPLVQKTLVNQVPIIVVVAEVDNEVFILMQEVEDTIVAGDTMVSGCLMADCGVIGLQWYNIQTMDKARRLSSHKECLNGYIA
jgi:hypothetical protein